MTLRLSNPLSPLADPGYVEATLRRHFEPLFDPHFDEILRAHYPCGVRFAVNGQTLARARASAGILSTVELRLPRKRTPSAFGYLAREEVPLPEERRGVAISTFGKVIKRGWEWLGVAPMAPDRVRGLVEAPGLAAALTLSKGDFLRSGPRGALYLSYRKALQEATMSQLSAWGEAPDSVERSRRRAARPVERDLEAILADLSGHFPLLAALVERRAGGTRTIITSAANGAAGEAIDLFAVAAESSQEELTEVEITDSPVETPAPERGNEAGAPAVGDLPPDHAGRRRVRRPVRLRLTIQFESRPDDSELSRLVESTVWVNDAHPAYRRAAASRSEGYHLALSVAMALADIAVERSLERTFVTEFLVRWGDSAGKPGKRGHNRRGGAAMRGGAT